MKCLLSHQQIIDFTTANFCPDCGERLKGMQGPEQGLVGEARSDSATGPAEEKAEDRLALTACSRLADFLESPPPYRKHCTREGLWLVIDAHGDSVLWSEQEVAVDAAVEALNHMAGIITENEKRPSTDGN